MPGDSSTIDKASPLILLFISIVALLVVGAFVFGAVRGLGRWRKDNASPVLTTEARIITKRIHVAGVAGDSSTTTS